MILDAIVAAKRAAHAARDRDPLPRPLDELWAQVRALPPTRPFSAALHDEARARPRVIAEFKRRSPSAGDIRPGADPAVLASAYAAHGAAALSVLTDEQFFDGQLAHIAAARGACALPVLRKDFLLDERDLLEARLAGADAVLLIVRILDRRLLGELLGVAASAGLDALVEVHDDAELDVASDAGASLIGINHRNLDTLAIDLSLSRGARALVPPGTTLVAESGIRTPDDVRRMRDHGVDAILVGESLMRAIDPGIALAALMAAAATGARAHPQVKG